MNSPNYPLSRALFDSANQTVLIGSEYQNLLNILIQTMPDPVWVKDAKGVFLACNVAFARLYNEIPINVIGHTDADFVDQEIANFFLKKDQEAMAADEPLANEEWVTFLGDKHQALWETIKVKIHDSAGVPIGVLGVARDITVRKHLENDLREKEQYQRALLDNFPFMVWLKDIDGRLLAVNRAYVEAAGLDPHVKNATDAFYGKTDLDFFPKHLAEHYQADDREVLRTGLKKVVEEPIGSDGHLTWHETYKAPVIDADGKLLGTVGFARDISKRKRIQHQLELREAEFRTLAENLPDIIVRYDLNLRRVFVNQQFEDVYKVAIDQVFGKTPTEYWASPAMSAQSFEAMLRGVIETGETIAFETEWNIGTPEYLCVAIRAVAEFDEDHNVVSVLSVGRDITALKLAQSLLISKEQDFRMLVENSPDSIARYDRECRRVYLSPKLLTELGENADFVLGKTPMEFPGDATSQAFQVKIMEVIETGQPLDFEFRCNQDQICTHVRMTPEFDSFGGLTHVLTVGRDITEIDRYRQKVHHQAFFDALTDLPNRSLLLDRIQQTIADAQYHQHQFGFMMLDLDHFKEINDSLGHSVGDALLCEVAKTLQQAVRSYDTVARLGGDEFAILLPAIRQSGDLAIIAEKILQSFINPFHLFGKEIFVSVSIGIVLYPTDSDEVDALFKYADSSMYHAKRLGRNNFQFYSKTFTERATERLMMEAALRKATLRDEFELYFQPQIELSTGKCVGAEALIRWNHAELGLVMPDKFIQIAEESGLIVDIGAWVLLAACQKIADYNSHYHSDLKLAVNLSTRQFIRNDLVATVVNILKKTSCKPEWIELEITESLLLEDSAEVANALLHFHEMGLTIAIDDFGTGYSALGYLNRFPVSQIKIDRSFVMDVPENMQKSELVKAILSLADALGIDVVAEGIETEESANFLLQQGCGLGQGYYFGRPMPWSQLITFLHHE